MLASRFSTNAIHRSEQIYCLLRRCGGSAVSVPIRSSCSFLPACFIDNVILSHTCRRIPNKVTHIWIQMNQTAWGCTREIVDNILSPQDAQWVLRGQRVICWFSFVDLKLFDSIRRRALALTRQWEQRSHVNFISYLTHGKPQGLSTSWNGRRTEEHQEPSPPCLASFLTPGCHPLWQMRKVKLAGWCWPPGGLCHWRAEDMER